MQIKDIMSKYLYTVTPDMDISQVAKVLKENKIHGVPVLEGKHLVGIITESDFFTKGEFQMHLPSYIDFLNKTGLAQQDEKQKEEFAGILNAKAGDIMTTQCVTVSPEDDVKVFTEIIKKHGMHTVPVVIGDILIGIVTVADIVELL